MFRKLTNKRNQYGYKNCCDCYLTIKDVKYIQFQDFGTRAICEVKYPGCHFIERTIDNSFNRVYIKHDDLDKTK